VTLTVISDGNAVTPSAATIYDYRLLTTSTSKERSGEGGTVDQNDRSAIEELLRTYCYVVDDAQWDALSQVFTGDVHFVNDFSGTDLVGIAPVTDWYRTGTHPAAHVLANVVIAPRQVDRAAARSKYITVQRTGFVGTGEYHDELVRTGNGWRVEKRTVIVKSSPAYNQVSGA
jgi:3-phenylpropionate/cinnamic acid dioxygenase small subunit